MEERRKGIDEMMNGLFTAVDLKSTRNPYVLGLLGAMPSHPSHLRRPLFAAFQVSNQISNRNRQKHTLQSHAVMNAAWVHRPHRASGQPRDAGHSGGRPRGGQSVSVSLALHGCSARIHGNAG